MSKRVRSVSASKDPPKLASRQRKSKRTSTRKRKPSTTRVLDQEHIGSSSVPVTMKREFPSRSKKVDEVDEASPWIGHSRQLDNAPNLSSAAMECTDRLETLRSESIVNDTNDDGFVFHNDPSLIEQSRGISQETTNNSQMLELVDESVPLLNGTLTRAAMNWKMGSPACKAEPAFTHNAVEHARERCASVYALLKLSPRIRGGCDDENLLDDKLFDGGNKSSTESTADPCENQINCNVPHASTPSSPKIRSGTSEQATNVEEDQVCNVRQRNQGNPETGAAIEVADISANEMSAAASPSMGRTSSPDSFDRNQFEKRNGDASYPDNEPRTAAINEPADPLNVDSSGFTGESSFPESFHPPTNQTDANAYYVEELHYSLGRREPLPQAPPLPQFPPEGSLARWEFDQDSRVLYADFRGMNNIPGRDREFLGDMLQRDDLTVISKGLFEEVNLDLWNPKYFNQIAGDRYYHKFRRFDRSSSNTSIFAEHPSFVVMRISDFFRYLSTRSIAQSQLNCATVDRTFTFKNKEGKDILVGDVLNTVFYMIDVDMLTYAPEMFEDLKKHFKLPEILPGGSWCMLNSVPPASRPFMGPNMYLTPGGGFTQLHQDGHGTVDSGHLNLAGFNEVVMLRRLPEEHKKMACEMAAVARTTQNGPTYDPLYGLPHADNVKTRPPWPTTSTVEKWKMMNYYPSVFILRPGEHVHINKGRLHAFRKMTCEALPKNDCHAALRDHIIKSENLKADQFCFSVAYDWMFRGVEANAINREISYMLESAALCRVNKKRSLAIPESTVLHLAKTLSAGLASHVVDTAPVDFIGFQANTSQNPGYKPSDLEVCRGILPSLEYVVEASRCTEASASAIVAKSNLPDADENPLTFSIDPFGSDYYCLLCSRELSNVYFHCEGCEQHLSKDYNICSFCFREEAYVEKNQMNSVDDQKRSDIVHTGKPWRKNGRFCSCHRGVCKACGFCKSCSCDCHMKFSCHQRHFTNQQLQSILTKCKESGVPELQYASATKMRLERYLTMNRQSGRHALKPGVLNSQCEETRTTGRESCIENPRNNWATLNVEITSAGSKRKALHGKRAKQSSTSSPRKLTKSSTKPRPVSVDAVLVDNTAVAALYHHKGQSRSSNVVSDECLRDKVSIATPQKRVRRSRGLITHVNGEDCSSANHLIHEIGQEEQRTSAAPSSSSSVDIDVQLERQNLVATDLECRSECKSDNHEAPSAILALNSSSILRTHELKLETHGLDRVSNKVDAHFQPATLQNGVPAVAGVVLETQSQYVSQNYLPQVSRENCEKTHFDSVATDHSVIFYDNTSHHVTRRDFKRKPSRSTSQSISMAVPAKYINGNDEGGIQIQRRPRKMPDRYC